MPRVASGPTWLGPALYWVGILAATMTAFYMFRALFMTFFGEFRAGRSSRLAEPARTTTATTTPAHDEGTEGPAAARVAAGDDDPADGARRLRALRRFFNPELDSKYRAARSIGSSRSSKAPSTFVERDAREGERSAGC